MPERSTASATGVLPKSGCDASINPAAKSSYEVARPEGAAGGGFSFSFSFCFSCHFFFFSACFFLYASICVFDGAVYGLHGTTAPVLA